jgi:acetylglutamate kinase
MRPIVLKFGGELLEDPARLAVAVTGVAAIARRGVPLAVVHGGGKEIDAALKAAGIPKRQVEGLRITDDATLEVVVSVLAGAINTRFTAALGAAGVRGVGLTGVDGRCGLSDPAPPHRTVGGDLIDLGRVGVPSAAADTTLVSLLAEHGFVPVLACIGVGDDGQLYNVNADTFAGRLAARLGATRLVIAGTTPGVLDGNSATISNLSPVEIEKMIGSGTATAGMIAKLRACEDALAAGVDAVVIVDGRDAAAIEAAAFEVAPGKATYLAPAQMSA